MQKLTQLNYTQDGTILPLRHHPDYYDLAPVVFDSLYHRYYMRPCPLPLPMMLQTPLTPLLTTLRLLSQTVNILSLPETQPSFKVIVHDVDRWQGS